MAVSFGQLVLSLAKNLGLKDHGSLPICTGPITLSMLLGRIRRPNAASAEQV